MARSSTTRARKWNLKDVRMTAALLPLVFAGPNWRTERVKGRIFENPLKFRTSDCRMLFGWSAMCNP